MFFVMGLRATRRHALMANHGLPAEVGWHTVELFDAAYRLAAADGRGITVDSLYITTDQREAAC